MATTRRTTLGRALAALRAAGWHPTCRPAPRWWRCSPQGSGMLGMRCYWHPNALGYTLVVYYWGRGNRAGHRWRYALLTTGTHNGRAYPLLAAAGRLGQVLQRPAWLYT